MIAIIRDDRLCGVRVDRIDGWEPKHGGTRVHLSGGGIVDLVILPSEFVERLDRALTVIAQDGAA